MVQSQFVDAKSSKSRISPGKIPIFSWFLWYNPHVCPIFDGHISSNSPDHRSAAPGPVAWRPAAPAAPSVGPGPAAARPPPAAFSSDHPQGIRF